MVIKKDVEGIPSGGEPFTQFIQRDADGKAVWDSISAEATAEQGFNATTNADWTDVGVPSTTQEALDRLASRPAAAPAGPPILFTDFQDLTTADDFTAASGTYYTIDLTTETPFTFGTVTLPDPDEGAYLGAYMKVKNASGLTWTGTVLGLANIILTADGTGFILFGDGTEWKVLSCFNTIGVQLGGWIVS